MRRYEHAAKLWRRYEHDKHAMQHAEHEHAVHEHGPDAAAVERMLRPHSAASVICGATAARPAGAAQTVATGAVERHMI